MTKKTVNESIRIAKEGIEECWGDMDMQQATPAQGEGPMTVTINMPGKNISVTTDSVDEIANILKLAGIQIGGMSADAEMPADMSGIEEPAVMYVGSGTEGVPSVPPQPVAGDNDGDGDHDMADHDIEHQDHEDSESAEEEAAEDEAEDEVEEAVGDKSYTSKGGTVTQTATGVTHQAGSGTYGGTETDAEEKARKDAEQAMAKKELPEAVEELDEETARILQLAGVTNEAQSAAQKAAFAKMIAKKNGGKSDDKSESDSKDDNKKPDADGDGVPDWADKDKEVKEEAPATNSVFGQGVYEQSYARILELAGLIEGTATDDLKKISTAALKAASSGDAEADKKSGVSATFSTAQIKAELKRREVAESKLMNSPAGTSMDEPQEFDSLPSGRGDGAGRKDFGANRANNQGENPMGMQQEGVEEAFERAMGEYRKFVAESISRKK